MILRREDLVEKLEKFERLASDPNRFFEKGKWFDRRLLRLYIYLFQVFEDHQWLDWRKQESGVLITK